MSDKQMMQEEQPLQVYTRVSETRVQSCDRPCGQHSAVAEFEMGAVNAKDDVEDGPPFPC